VASDLDNLPKFGPEEINIAAVVNRQARVDASVQDIACKVNELATNQERFLMTETSFKDMTTAVEQIAANCTNTHLDLNVEPISRLVVEMQEKLETFSSSVCSRLDRLNSLCSASVSRPPSNLSPGAVTHQPLRQPAEVDIVDRKSNLIIFGVAEDRDLSVWHGEVDAILKFVVDRQVDVMDTFRIGRYTADSNGVARKPRPILVKLRVAWDKRIILSKCSKLKSYSKRGIFILPDEPVEVRRKNTVERLKYRAEKDGKSVLITDNILIIDGVKVFSLQTGYLNTVNG
jgi:hypothetical protein